ncbi:hypothetical protein OGAPHI_005708 [Ogataea philodendri]|uniref:Uncharacterized protein n=1 Tax=Ogataea philodendri TaxID=1378263 RepID=A0A9P8P050_9ASCO|nr:uncharacterized protein OGAPHI_005708 [Ogataea philodendri]KAH3662456.1 hypothetical protein OGAPHI_005708 [Ogataea philodendri]
MSKNGGMVVPIITKVNVVLITELNTAANTRGRAESILAISWLNLLMTRPSGVVSKKDIGDAKTALAISLCSFLEARIEHQLHMVMALIKLAAPTDLRDWTFTRSAGSTPAYSNPPCSISCSISAKDVEEDPTNGVESCSSELWPYSLTSSNNLLLAATTWSSEPDSEISLLEIKQTFSA